MVTRESLGDYWATLLQSRVGGLGWKCRTPACGQRERSPSHSLEAQTGPQLDTEVAPDTVDPLILPDLPATPAVQLVPPTVDQQHFLFL